MPKETFPPTPIPCGEDTFDCTDMKAHHTSFVDEMLESGSDGFIEVVNYLKDNFSIKPYGSNTIMAVAHNTTVEKVTRKLSKAGLSGIDKESINERVIISPINDFDVVISVPKY